MNHRVHEAALRYREILELTDDPVAKSMIQRCEQLCLIENSGTVAD